jgi:hypothetical protein
MITAEKGGGQIWVVMKSSILAHPGDPFFSETRLPSQIGPIPVWLAQKARLMAQAVKNSKMTKSIRMKKE